jgi:hypothetical protein
MANALLNAETQAAEAVLYVHIEAGYDALCLGPWRAMRSRRATAQMRGEFPQIDRICVTIVGIGTAKII